MSNISFSDGWKCIEDDKLPIDDGKCVSGDNFCFVRLEDCTEPNITVKIAFDHVVRLDQLEIICNARFAEVYIQLDTLLKYHTTIRGVNTPEANIFASSCTEPLEFREIHLKFLSIKPNVSPTIEEKHGGLQLKVSKLLLCHSASLSGNSKPDRVAANQQGMDMMAMMAMSMMAPGVMGGNNHGGGGNGLTSLIAMSAPHKQNNPNITPPPQNKPLSTEHVISDHKFDNKCGNKCDNNHTSETKQPETTNDQSILTPPPAQKPAPKPAPAQASHPPAAGIDISQLASILWTVKGSVVSEIEELLDRKLSPILSRLDAVEVQLREIKVTNAALIQNTNNDSSNSSNNSSGGKNNKDLTQMDTNSSESQSERNALLAINQRCENDVD